MLEKLPLFIIVFFTLSRYFYHQPCHRTQFPSKVVSILKVESLENEKFLRNKSTLNFQSGFDSFDDLLKKTIYKA